MKRKIAGLAKTVGESLFGEMIDPALDIAEYPVDLLFEDGSPLEAVPFVKTIFALGKTCASIHDKYLYKRLIIFIQEINKGEISQEKKDEFSKKLLKNDKTYTATLERLLLFLTHSIHDEQAIYLGRFFIAFINGDVSWNTMQELAEANHRMFICDYDVLGYIVSKTGTIRVRKDLEASVSRLASLGIINDLRVKQSGILVREEYKDEGIVLTEFGEVFVKFIDKKPYNIEYEINEVFRDSKYLSPNEKEKDPRTRDKEIIEKVAKSCKNTSK